MFQKKAQRTRLYRFVCCANETNSRVSGRVGNLSPSRALIARLPPLLQPATPMLGRSHELVRSFLHVADQNIDGHSRIGVRQDPVVDLVQDVDLLFVFGGLRAVVQELRSRHGNRHVLLAVDDAKGLGVAGNGGFPDRFQRQDQGPGRSQLEGFPGGVEAHALSLGVGVVVQDVLVPPDPARIDRVGHEEGGPLRKPRCQALHEDHPDDVGGQVPHDGGADQEARVKVLGGFLRVVLEVPGDQNGERPAKGFSRQEQRDARGVLARRELAKGDQVVPGVLPRGDEKTGPLREPVAVLVPGVDGHALVHKCLDDEGDVEGPVVDQRGVARLGMDAVGKDQHPLEFVFRGVFREPGAVVEADPAARFGFPAFVVFPAFVAFAGRDFLGGARGFVPPVPAVGSGSSIDLVDLRLGREHLGRNFDQDVLAEQFASLDLLCHGSALCCVVLCCVTVLCFIVSRTYCWVRLGCAMPRCSTSVIQRVFFVGFNRAVFSEVLLCSVLLC
mmetsp:Transcript_18616/g.42517  ORF Transcript_18616/g.42517 Transcript_18616/m.42517 type:complete len:501 (-) Transcript_18616:193-1695(-)